MVSKKITGKSQVRPEKVAAGSKKSKDGRRRVIERAADIAIELYGPALRELEKH